MEHAAEAGLLLGKGQGGYVGRTLMNARAFIGHSLLGQFVLAHGKLPSLSGSSQNPVEAEITLN